MARINVGDRVAIRDLSAYRGRTGEVVRIDQRRWSPPNAWWVKLDHENEVIRCQSLKKVAPHKPFFPPPPPPPRDRR
jgi:hypothetical protein